MRSRFSQPGQDTDTYMDLPSDLPKMNRRRYFSKNWTRCPTLVYIVALAVIAIMSYLYLLPLATNQMSIQTFDEGIPDSKVVVNPDPSPPLLSADANKRDAIVDAFKHAWHAYERDAMGMDEYHPIRHQGSNLGSDGGIGYTVTDAIDTILIMGLDAEYTRARQWVRKKLSFDRHGNFNNFETTIRVLGGLLAAYHLSGDKLYLDKADDLASRMMPSFNTPSGLPLPMTNLGKREAVPDQWTATLVSTAEAATLQLEFKYLAEMTGKKDYWYKVEKVMEVINKASLPHHLVPIYMNSDQGTFTESEIRLGSRGDSYYEYLLKQYLQTNRTETIYQKMYDDAMQGIHDNLVKKTPTRKMTYIAELIPRRGANGENTYDISPKQDHLVCFLAGSLMLGATTSGARSKSVSVPPKMTELTEKGQRDWKTGVELLETCMYTHETETGLSPEIVQFHTAAPPAGERDWYIKNSRKGGPSGYDARYMLRPETVESLFLAWRLTGDVKYRKYAWSIFSAIEKHARLSGGGYATILDVDTVPVSRDDKQETFFLSETLKYLYLTFTDSSVIPLKDYVFNTEAHPLPIFRPTITPAFS